MSQGEAYTRLKRISDFASSRPSIKEKFRSWTKAFQFKPNDVHPFFLEIKEGKIQVSEGIYKSPLASLISNHQDLIDILTGKLDPFKAFFLGKLKIEGNIAETQNLNSLLREVLLSPDFGTR